MKKLLTFLFLCTVAFFSCKHKSKENIAEPIKDAPNANLFSILFSQKGSLVASFEGYIEDELNVEPFYPPSSDVPLLCRVTTTTKTGRVFFNDDVDSKNTASFTSLNADKTIIITSKDGKRDKEFTKRYRIKVSLPELNSPSSEDNLVVNVLGFVAGSNIRGVKIECFSQDSLISEKTTDSNGNAYFKLEPSKYYDFVASKKGRAESRVQHFFLDSTSSMQKLIMISRKKAVGFKTIAPKMRDIRIGNAEDNPTNMQKLQDNAVLDLALLSNKGIFVETISPSGKYIPNKAEHGENNFGLMIGIGHRYSSVDSLNIVFKPEPKAFEDGKLSKKEGDAIVQRYFLPFTDIAGISGEETIYITFYDIGGNRGEYQKKVNIKGNIENKVGNANIITRFEAETRRFPKALNTFGIGHHNGLETACNVVFSFDVSKEYINGIEVYRREKKDTNGIGDNWEKIITRIYPEPFSGTKINNKGKTERVFKIVDDIGDVEEGKTYQYKIAVIIKKEGLSSDEGKFFSPVATLSILPAFGLKLKNPSHYEKVKFGSIQNMSFSFNVSNTNLLKKENSDYFIFGLLILDNETWQSGKTNREGLRYAIKVRYYFDKDSSKKLELIDRNSGKWKEYNKFLGADALNIHELITFSEEGNVVISSKLLNIGDFNMAGGLPLKKCLTFGNMYYWDVGDFGSDYIGTLDDKAAFFAKEVALQDSKTGTSIEGLSVSYSIGNGKREGSALNGRFAFSVVE